jgi:NAD(P)-dependent dehydrogenase (short-subunit alcohol dehydrogenase family)
VTDALLDRTAVVTGGGSGLGAAIATALHEAGARVIVVGRNTDKLQAVASRLQSRTRWHACDVSDPHSVEALREALVDEDVSILINNAGIPGPVSSMTDIDVAEWDDVFAVNVRGTFLMCKAFLPPMMARGKGDIVNIASVSGKRPLVHRTPYCASKMAVIGLSSTLAFEAGPAGVNVNTLSPGPVTGPRMERNFRLESERSGGSVAEAEQAFVSRAALGRMITEQEVGAAVVGMLGMPGLCGSDIDLSAGMIA